MKITKSTFSLSIYFFLYALLLLITPLINCNNKFLPTDKERLCNSCVKLFNKIQNFFKKNYISKIIVLTLDQLCYQGMDNKICEKMNLYYGEDFTKGLVNRQLHPGYVCTRMELCTNGKYYEELNADDFAKELYSYKTANKTDFINSNSEKNKKPENKIIKIAHLADIHVDLLYQEVIT